MRGRYDQEVPSRCLEDAKEVDDHEARAAPILLPLGGCPISIGVSRPGVAPKTLRRPDSPPLVASHQFRLAEDMPPDRPQHLSFSLTRGEGEVGVQRIEGEEVAVARALPEDQPTATCSSSTP